MRIEYLTEKDFINMLYSYDRFMLLTDEGWKSEYKLFDSFDKLLYCDNIIWMSDSEGDQEESMYVTYADNVFVCLFYDDPIGTVETLWENIDEHIDSLNKVLDPKSILESTLIMV